jgi:hypothetical protein
VCMCEIQACQCRDGAVAKNFSSCPHQRCPGAWHWQACRLMCQWG